MHYGPPSNFFLAVRNSHPEALTPNPHLAYHSGGLYEVLIGAIVWPLRKRLKPWPLALMWLMLALLALARFFEFFLRSDSGDLALGLETAQWTSLLLLAITVVGAGLTLGGDTASRREPSPPASRRSRRT